MDVASLCNSSDKPKENVAEEKLRNKDQDVDDFEPVQNAARNDSKRKTKRCTDTPKGHASDQSGDSTEDEAKDLSKTPIKLPPPVEDEVFWVKNNISKNYRIIKYRSTPGAIDSWNLLTAQNPVSPISCRGESLYIGDLVQVCLDPYDPQAVAEVAEIRNLPDGQRFLRIFWCLKKEDVFAILEPTTGRKPGRKEREHAFPEPYKFVRTNHVQVISLESVERTVGSERVLPRKVLMYKDGASDKAELLDEECSEVKWTLVKKRRPS